KKYQKGIYEYIQHLKETNNFNYVKLVFIVIDKRVLEDEFENLGIKYKLIRAKDESKTEKEFLLKREKIMSQIKETSIDKSEKIRAINRDGINKSYEYHGYNALVGTTVISELALKSDSIDNPEEIGKTYDKIEDVKLKKSSRHYY
ncbi:MAG: hypothetical protein ACRC0S_07320, partial [Fusobacteriaceae bacterium]